jgi:hypothetical protein
LRGRAAQAQRWMLVVIAMKHFFMLSLVLLSAFETCERATKVTITPDNPPTFLLSGSGELGDLRIYGPKQRDVSSDLSFVVWEIQPIDGFNNGKLLEEIGSIKYGVVPEGYKQIYPENRATPLALVPGEKYSYWFQTINAPHARAYFEIRANKAVEIPK